MQLNNRSFLSSIMPVTKHLLVINFLVWLATIVFVQAGIIDLNQWLALHFWQSPDFNLVQLVTYMFLHANFMHIFFNMFSLWMFGSLLERVMGSKRFLTYYLVCGIGAGLIQELTWHLSGLNFYGITLGASGAVFGILLAFGMLFPNMKMFIIPFPFPIKAKWVVLGYGLLELYFGITGEVADVAHYAHLGGMVFGIILILYWKKTGKLPRNGIY